MCVVIIDGVIMKIVLSYILQTKTGMAGGAQMLRRWLHFDQAGGDQKLKKGPLGLWRGGSRRVLAYRVAWRELAAHAGVVLLQQVDQKRAPLRLRAACCHPAAPPPRTPPRTWAACPNRPETHQSTVHREVVVIVT